MWASLHVNQPCDIGLLYPAPARLVSAISYGFPCDAMWQEYTVALGDSYGDNMNPASDAYRYDPTKGVSLYSKVTYVNLGFNALTTVGGAFSQDELGTSLIASDAVGLRRRDITERMRTRQATTATACGRTIRSSIRGAAMGCGCRLR